MEMIITTAKKTLYVHIRKYITYLYIRKHIQKKGTYP